jgi:thiosulfate reductase cytochrome b subunit
MPNLAHLFFLPLCNFLEFSGVGQSRKSVTRMLEPEREKSTNQESVQDAAEVSPERVEALCGKEEEVASGNSSLQADNQAAPLPAATLRIQAKHPLAIRWMHWINFPVLATMIWSGLLIYWADSDHAYRFSHRVYRVGFGHWTLFRFFPPWFYDRLHLTFQLANGMGYHFFFMWLFGINGILYVLYTFVSGEWRYLVPNQHSFREAWQVLLHDLHLSKTEPPQRKFNGAQQIAYTSVIWMGLGSLLTGLAIYKPTQLGWITALLGGYEMARWLHFLLTLGYLVFFLVHVAQVVRAGWNNFRAMVTGYELIRVPAPEEE